MKWKWRQTEADEDALTPVVPHQSRLEEGTCAESPGKVSKDAASSPQDAAASEEDAEQVATSSCCRCCDPGPVKSYSEVGWLSFLTFSWVNPLVTEGLKRQVDLSDIPELGDKEDSARNTHRLLRQLQRMESARLSHPLLRAVVRTFWKEFLIQKLLTLSTSFIGITGPLLMQKMLVFQEAQNEDGAVLSQGQVIAGFAAIFALILKGLFEIVWHAQLGFYGKRVHYRIESALRGAVLYRCVQGSKAFGGDAGTSETTTSQEKQASTPAVYNVISFDVGPNISVIGVAMGVWSFPIGFAVNLMVLYDQVHAGVLPGLAVVIVAKGICFALMAMDGVLRDRLLRAKDERLQRCSEGFLGVRTLQMLGWVPPFQEEILHARKQELRAQQMRLWIKSMTSAIDTSLGTCLALVTLAYYVKVDGQELKASVALPVIGLVGGLVGPLGHFPGWVNTYLVWRSAYGRVNDYLGFHNCTSRSPATCARRWKWRLMWFALLLALLASGAFTAFGYVLGWTGNTKLFWSAGWGLAWCGIGVLGVWLIDAPRRKNEQPVAGLGDTDSKHSAAALETCTLSWHGCDPADDAEAPRFRLRDVDLEVRAGEVLVLSGQAGHGKSSVLLALLGEMHVESGTLRSPAVERQKLQAARSATHVLPKDQHGVRDVLFKHNTDKELSGDSFCTPYASQDTMLFSATLRDNILLGAMLKPGLYNEVLAACALEPDLETMPLGDLTVIVQGGANLSGGQRARVGLARAAYRAALGLQERAAGEPVPVVLLDDPFSALDRRVAEQVCQSLFSANHGGLLARCAVLVATADPWWLRFLDGNARFATVSQGIVRQGSVDLAPKALTPEASHMEDQDMPEFFSPNARIPTRPQLLSHGSASQDEEVKQDPTPSRTSPRAESLGDKTTLPRELQQGGDSSDDLEATYSKEHRASGSVRLHTYVTYVKAVGVMTLSVLLVSLVGIMVSQNLCSLWLTYWTSPDKSASFMHPSVKVFAGDIVDDPTQLLNIYAAFVGSYAFFNFMGFGLEVIGGVNAARTIFINALQGTLAKPARWWDANPTGRVLNRFSEDVEQMDNAVTYMIGIIFGAVLYFIGHAFILAVANPTTLAALPVVALVLEYYARYYRKTIREVQRIWLTCMSTVYQDMVEAVVGRVTIRAFGVMKPTLCRSMEGLHRLQRAGFGKEAINDWIGFRFQLLSWLVSLYTTLYPVFQYYGIFSKQSAALVGFSIHYSAETVGIIKQFINNFSSLEIQLVSIERLEEYAQTEVAEESLQGILIDEEAVACPCPLLGLHLEDVTVTYHEGLQAALSGVTLSIAPREAVAIVGRTGAGKTTLLLSVLQMVPYTGSMKVDGQLLASQDPEDVRRRKVGIVPQHPLLFDGDIRWNLDPEGRYRDEELWDALAAAGLEDVCRSCTLGLSTRLATSGGGTKGSHELSELLSLSQSQRQLLCSARVVLRRQRVVMMDEVTASLDQDVAGSILKSLVQTFRGFNSAVMVVTHQEELLPCCQRVITIAAGKVVDVRQIEEEHS